MRRYWIEFDLSAYAHPHNHPAIIKGGCGVTAVDHRDALVMIGEHIFLDGLPRVSKVIEDVDVFTLDEGHVLPNMGNVLVRGIWFPLGLTPESRLSW